jgi:hypothetical protein
MPTFFSDFFRISPKNIHRYGAFDVSLVNDLPLFIDPFLLFNSKKRAYRKLHDQIIEYLVFLRDKAGTTEATDGNLRLWYCFKEVKQNWLGFSETGNSGSGLGPDFARSLHKNLNLIFQDFGSEKITEASHLEKVCLVKDGVGRDNISDFTTNLIKDFLCSYTQAFAEKHLPASAIRTVAVSKAVFNYQTQSWEPRSYRLPWANGDYVILTPRDMLTRDHNWINRDDLVGHFDSLPPSISDEQLRAQVENYFRSALARPRHREPNKKERDAAAARTILRFPILLDYYIRYKEEKADEATDISAERVLGTEQVYVIQVRDIQKKLAADSEFYRLAGGTYKEAHARLAYLKDNIENKGGHRLFYDKGRPIEREKDLQILYRLVWFGSPSDVGAEANDGRGPVDFKISRGGKDKTLVEMKLAKNSKLEQNLQKQVEIYKKASDAKNAIKVIIYFTRAEKARAQGILDKLGLLNHKDVVLIDARDDNKPSGSKA